MQGVESGVMDICSYGRGNFLADLPGILKAKNEEVLYLGAIVYTCLQFFLWPFIMDLIPLNLDLNSFCMWFSDIEGPTYIMTDLSSVFMEIIFVLPIY